MSAADVAIVAVGARTPIGLTAESSAAAVRGGINRLRRFEWARGEERTACRDTRIDPAVTSVTRFTALAETALKAVIAKLALGRLPREQPIPVLLGLPERRPGWSDQDGRQLAGQLAGSGNPLLIVETLPLGHAAGLECVRHAVHALAQGRGPCVIVGGVESFLDPQTLLWLDYHRRWKSEDARDGIIPGEGAAFVALMRPSDARSAGLPILALVRAVASTRETRLIHTDAVNLGEGLGAAVEAVVSSIGNGVVDEIYCDINGQRFRSEEWGFVAMRQSGRFRDPTAYRSAVGRWGDAGAATGVLNVVLAVQAWQRYYARGDHALIWGSSEGGLRSAALLSRAQGNP